MRIKDKIGDKKLRYDIKKKLQKYQHYDQIKIINMNILYGKKYYHLIESEYSNFGVPVGGTS